MQNYYPLAKAQAYAAGADAPMPEFVHMAAEGPVPAPPFGHSWAGLMRMALICALNAGSQGDIPVGAVIATPAGKILGWGCNRVERDFDPCAHAEIMALRMASRRIRNPRLTGAILVTTLEPCLMCAGAIAHARIAGLVFGASDPRAGALNSAADLEALPLGGRTYWRMGGILGLECANLLNSFFDQLRKGKN